MSDSYITIQRDPEYNVLFSDKLTHFRKRHKFTDCKIMVGEETIHCHANIICAFSPMFERMLESNMMEAITREVCLHSVPASAMHVILDYMYTGVVNVAKSGLVKLVQVSDYLQLLGLRDQILAHLPSVLSCENVMSWMQVAGLLQLEGVVDRCRHFIAGSFSHIARGREFMESTGEELKAFLQEAHDLNVPQCDILLSLFSWIDVDVEKRCGVLGSLFDVSMLQTCSGDELATIADKYKAILALNSTFHGAITQAIQDKNTLPKQVALNEHFSLVVIGGDDTNKCWKMDNTSKEFQVLTEIPGEMLSSQHRVCVYEGVGLIYIGGPSRDMCALYTAATGQWTLLARLTTRRTWHGAVCILHQLYIIGGDVAGYWATSVQSLNLKDECGSWQTEPSMPIKLWHPKSASHGPDIYVMGNNTPHLLHYDSMAREWSHQAGLPQDPGCAFRLTTAAGGDMYAVGGDRHICFVYKPRTDTWMKLKAPSVKHQSAALTYHEGRVVVLGGGCADIEVYDTEHDTWTVQTYTLPHAMQFHSAFSVLLPE